MRRFLIALLALTLVMAPTLALAAPVTSTTTSSPTVAPYQVPTNGVWYNNIASVTVANTTSAATICSALVPAGLMQAPPVTPVTGSTWTQPAAVAAPLHVKMFGVMSTSSTTASPNPGTLTMGVSFGPNVTGVTAVQPAASFTAVNVNGTIPALWAGMNNSPFIADFWIMPMPAVNATGFTTRYASGSWTSTPAWLQSRVEFSIYNVGAGTASQQFPSGSQTINNQNSNGATTVGTNPLPNTIVLVGGTITDTNLASQNTLNISWQWGSANAFNSLTVFNCSGRVGD